MTKQRPHNRPGSSRLRGAVSLARALSKLGFASRSESVRLISAGRVTVDGRIVREAEHWVDLGSVRIAVDGKRSTKHPDRGIMLFKPAGVVTTRSDEKGRQTVFDLLGAAGTGLKTVGRLDMDTTGLLLFVTDNRLADALTDPSRNCAKTYAVRTDHEVSADALEALRSGVAIRADGQAQKTRPAEITRTGNCQYEVTISEGKNRQVRKMFEAAGANVIALHRTHVAGLKLDLRQPGGWRELTKEEMNILRVYLKKEE